MQRSIEDRFLEKVEKTSGCWLWKAATVKSSLTYGHFWNGTKNETAHRFSYRFYVGTIPEGMTIDHICKNGLCVKPDHLRVLTLRENILLGSSPTAINKRKRFCVNGHELTEENLLVPKKRNLNGRNCRLCKRRQDRKRNKENYERLKDYKREWQRKSRATKRADRILEQ